MGTKNLVEQLWNEAQNIWCQDGEVELVTLLKCFVSVRTGDPEKKPIAEGSMKLFSEALVGIATGRGYREGIRGKTLTVV